MLTLSQITSIIMLLQAFGVSPSIINEVQTELNADQATTTIQITLTSGTKTTQAPSPAGTSSDSSSSKTVYSPVSIAQYFADVGQSVLITGMESSFLSSASASNGTNYIQIENPFDQSQPKVEVEVDNRLLFKAAVNALQNPSSPILSFIRVYGQSVASQPFIETNLFGSSITVMMPVVNATRIDQCLHGSMNTTVVNTDFNSNFSCSYWVTLSPSATVATPTPTVPTPTPIPTPSPYYPDHYCKFLDQNYAFSCRYWATQYEATQNGWIIPEPNCPENVTSFSDGTLGCRAAPQVTPTPIPTPPSFVPTATPIPTPTSTPAPLHTDATLSALLVNGIAVSNFASNIYTYTVLLPAGSVVAPTVAPTVAATTNDPNATYATTQAANSLGTAMVVVTAQNGVTNTYTLNFRPSNAGQCNFNGSIFYCATNAGITVSPTVLPSATVGVSYSQPISITDSDTSSQNFRWNIISGFFPPGLGLAFSPNKAIRCTGTYCFFDTPPSGVSVPSNSPGTFFGTPTTVGTYSFTFQAIDNLNYITMPTFTITVGTTTGG